MDKIKYLIMLGGSLILLGIIFKIIGLGGPWAAISFSVGGTLKLLYLVLGTRSGLIKPGAEMGLLALGLVLIFAAVYLRKTEQVLYLYGWLLSAGILVKILFVILFIRKQKRYRKELAVE
ncbi:MULTISPECIES: hypothetical protein [unclassified Carboxylicivirga]|uniref:hypothetical protein n=1 Tax=Carboxylicivirga TaxID=1628153 RepID=UPI003D356D5A